MMPALTTLTRTGDLVAVESPGAGAGLLDFVAGGVMMYPITFSALVALGFIAWSTWRLFGKDPRVDPQLEATVDGVLFWGSLALLLGVLGTVVGIAQAAAVVERIGEVPTSLVWGGIRVSLITTIWGGLILVASALSWLGLRMRCRALLARMV